MRKSKVLLVENDEKLTASLSQILTKNDYDINICSDLLKAERVLSYYIPEVIIIGVNAEGYEVDDFITDVKNQLPDTGVIVLSCTENELQSFVAGADDWLKKPIKLPILLAKIKVLTNCFQR